MTSLRKWLYLTHGLTDHQRSACGGGLLAGRVERYAEHHMARDRNHACMSFLVSLFSYKTTCIQSGGLYRDGLI